MRLCVLCLLSAGFAAAQPAALDYLPPNANIAIGINLRRMIDSAKLPDLIPDSQSQSLQMLALNGLGGLNPLKDIDSIIIASTGQGANPPTVVIVRGRFANWHPSAPKNAKSRVERIDDQTFLAGDAEAVQSAITRHGKPSAGQGKLAARVESLDAKYDLWGFGTVPEGFGSGTQSANGLDAIDRFEFGATFRGDLILEGEAHVRYAEDVKRLTGALRMVEDALTKQTKPANGAKFDLHVDRGTLKLSLLIPEAELKKAIAAQRASLMTAAPKVDTKGKIVTNAAGDTVNVTLPGGH